MNERSHSATRPLARSLHEYARGVAGGLLFSLPLLYTEEVWLTGIIASPRRLLAYLAATFVLLIGINHYAGLRRDPTFADVVVDSVEEMGIGLVVATAMLWLLDRTGAGEPVNEVVGQSVVAAMTVAIGVAVGTSQLGGGAEEDGGADSTEGGAEGGGFGRLVVTAWCGAVLFAANIAPTGEVARIGAHASLWKLAGLACVSLMLGALILYYSEFAGAGDSAGAAASGVLSGVVVTYAVALSASALSLWFYGRFEGASLLACVSQVVVLGVAATLGASAGRLLLQQGAAG